MLKLKLVTVKKNPHMSSYDLLEDPELAACGFEDPEFIAEICIDDECSNLSDSDECVRILINQAKNDQLQKTICHRVERCLKKARKRFRIHVEEDGRCLRLWRMVKENPPSAEKLRKCPEKYDIISHIKDWFIFHEIEKGREVDMERSVVINE